MSKEGGPKYDDGTFEGKYPYLDSLKQPPREEADSEPVDGRKRLEQFLGLHHSFNVGSLDGTPMKQDYLNEFQEIAQALEDDCTCDGDNVALQVLCRVFDDDPSDVMEEWRTFDKSGWLWWGRALGGFIRQRLEATVGDGPEESVTIGVGLLENGWHITTEQTGFRWRVVIQPVDNEDDALDLAMWVANSLEDFDDANDAELIEALRKAVADDGELRELTAGDEPESARRALELLEDAYGHAENTADPTLRLSSTSALAKSVMGMVHDSLIALRAALTSRQATAGDEPTGTNKQIPFVGDEPEGVEREALFRDFQVFGLLVRGATLGSPDPHDATAFPLHVTKQNAEMLDSVLAALAYEPPAQEKT